MLFNSFIFLFFLGAVVPLYYYSKPSLRKIVLLASSYLFYAYWDYRFCALILLTTLMDYSLGRLIDNAKDNKSKKSYLTLSIILNLVILGFFKYFNFFIESFGTLLSTFGINLDYLHIAIILPLGISFYTFKSLTYTIDVYKGELKSEKNFLNYAIYISFFPQLAAGPIERAKNLLPQIAAMAKPSAEQIKSGLVLITMGMLKKVLIGDTAGRIVDQIFAQPQYYDSSELLMGLVLFSVQVYADFSGYSNIARGTAKLLGFETMINFNQPYFAASITEFWRRWHISLSNWFRDYLFLPLAYKLTREFTFKKYYGISKDKLVYMLSTMATFLLCGLWHGANWTFIVWGALHGILLILHRFSLKGKRAKDRFTFISAGNTAKFLIKVIGTNIFITASWLFFRAKSFSEAEYFLSRIINWLPAEFDMRVFLITATFLLVTVIIDVFEYYYKDHEFILRLKPQFRYGFTLVCWAMILLYMFQAAPMPFIYSQF